MALHLHRFQTEARGNSKMACLCFMSQKQKAVKRRKTKKVWSNLVCKKPPVHLKKDNTSLYKS